MMLHEYDLIVEKGKRGEYMDDILNKVDKKDWGEKGEKFYDHIKNPKLDHELSSQSLVVAKQMRELMEKDRQEIIKRNTQFANY